MALSSSVTAPPPFLLVSLPGHWPGGWAGKRGDVTTSQSMGVGSNRGERVRLTGETCPGSWSMTDRTQGFQTPKRWNRLLPPDSSGAGDEVGAPRTFFLALGVG